MPCITSNPVSFKLLCRYAIYSTGAALVRVISGHAERVFPSHVLFQVSLKIELSIAKLAGERGDNRMAFLHMPVVGNLRRTNFATKVALIAGLIYKIIKNVLVLQDFFPWNNCSTFTIKRRGMVCMILNLMLNKDVQLRKGQVARMTVVRPFEVILILAKCWTITRKILTVSTVRV